MRGDQLGVSKPSSVLDRLPGDVATVEVGEPAGSSCSKLRFGTVKRNEKFLRANKRLVEEVCSFEVSVAILHFRSIAVRFVSVDLCSSGNDFSSPER